MKLINRSMRKIILLCYQLILENVLKNQLIIFVKKTDKRHELARLTTFLLDLLPITTDTYTANDHKTTT